MKIIMDTFLPWQGKCNTITLAAVPKQIFMTAMWTKLLLAHAQKSILAPLLPFLMRMWNIWICFQLVFVKTRFISFWYLNFFFCVNFDLPEAIALHFEVLFLPNDFMSINYMKYNKKFKGLILKGIEINCFHLMRNI